MKQKFKEILIDSLLFKKNIEISTNDKKEDIIGFVEFMGKDHFHLKFCLTGSTSINYNDIKNVKFKRAPHSVNIKDTLYEVPIPVHDLIFNLSLERDRLKTELGTHKCVDFDDAETKLIVFEALFTKKEVTTIAPNRFIQPVVGKVRDINSTHFTVENDHDYYQVFYIDIDEIYFT